MHAVEGSAERCAVLISPCEVRNFFHLRKNYSVISMGSRGTVVLCTASSRCTRIGDVLFTAFHLASI